MPESTQEYKFDKVMVIDDSDSDLYVAEHYLKKYFVAANVISVESATEGLNYLIQNANLVEQLPSIIFLDIRMPVMDGFEFLNKYEKLPSSVLEHCTVIMLSSSADPRDRERIKNNSLVKKFINKPLNQEKLQELLLSNIITTKVKRIRF
jgi:CheY-like chemotaxis protein